MLILIFIHRMQIGVVFRIREYVLAFRLACAITSATKAAAAAEQQYDPDTAVSAKAKTTGAAGFIAATAKAAAAAEQQYDQPTAIAAAKSTIKSHI
jgi:hypothetical protein